MGSPFNPKTGVFWFVATDPSAPSRMVSVLSPFNIDFAGRDLVASPHDHAVVWPRVQSLDPSLKNHDFEYFPRGRLEFSGPTRRWIVTIDSKLNRVAFIAYLSATWEL